MGYYCEKPQEACFICRHYRFNEESGRQECYQTEDIAKRTMAKARQIARAQKMHKI